jgi:DNA-binding MarR family transcriptional regulator
LTNYSIVLAYVALRPDSTVRTIAADVGITERAALSILRDLDDERIVRRTRNGRRNTYSVDFDRLTSMPRGDRETANSVVPRPFLDFVIKTLFDAAQEQGAVAHEPPAADSDVDSEARVGTWGFFTNHLAVLLAVAGDGERTVRELAMQASITERAAVAILDNCEPRPSSGQCAAAGGTPTPSTFKRFGSSAAGRSTHGRSPHSLSTWRRRASRCWRRVPAELSTGVKE